MNFTKLGVGAAASTAEGPEDGFTQKPQENRADITPCTFKKIKNKVQEKIFPICSDSQIP